jgi:hypothetical protein
MLRKKTNRLGAALILAAVLAVTTLAVPVGAAERSGRGEALEQILGGLLPRLLGWLGLTPVPGSPKCDHGSSIDPNGCPKSDGERGSSIDPNGLHAAAPAEGEHGASIDPDGLH